MENQIICVIFGFLIIYIIFYFLNIFLNKTMENYGIYCGRYNINKSTAQINCNADSECRWVPYTSKNGVQAGWCDEAEKS
jgi:hypothetical protein